MVKHLKKKLIYSLLTGRLKICIEITVPYLGFLPEVRREFEAGNIASVITHDDNGINGIKLYMSQLGILFGHHWLLADSLIFVDVEVKNVNLKKISDHTTQCVYQSFFPHF